MPPPTPAALFRRADTVWLVFDSTKPIDVEPIRGKGGSIIADVCQLPLDKGQAIRIRLNRPQMPSLTGDDQAGPGSNWTLTFADTMQTPTQPLVAMRNINDPAFANVTVPMATSGMLHRLVDPDAGDTILVVTAPPPVRGFIKRQDFVEMSLLELIHGVAIRPNSDDVTAERGFRQDHPRPARRLDAVVRRCRRRARVKRGEADLRRRRVAQESWPAILPSREDAFVDGGGSARGPTSARRRGSTWRGSIWRAQMYPEAKAVLDLVLADAKPGA